MSRASESYQLEPHLKSTPSLSGSHENQTVSFSMRHVMNGYTSVWRFRSERWHVVGYALLVEGSLDCFWSCGATAPPFQCRSCCSVLFCSRLGRQFIIASAAGIAFLLRRTRSRQELANEVEGTDPKLELGKLLYQFQ